MSGRRARATIVDIANELEIHPTSVSRALSGSSQVSEGTRQRVLAVAEQLNYVRNVHAAGLVTGSSKTLGVLLPNLTNPFFAELASQVQLAAAEHDYLVMVAASNMSSETEADLVSRMIEHADGTIVAIPTTTPALPSGAGLDRIGFVNRRVEGAASFIVDQEAIAQTQIDVLVEAGHRSIAFVDGPAVFESSSIRQQARARMASARDDLRFVDLGSFDNTGSDAADAYRCVPDDVTAVVAFNDIMALGIVGSAMSAGRRVPDDLSVVGSDGLDLARLFSPQLTTVRAPLAELASHVVEHLVTRSRPPGEPVMFAPSVVDGDTVARR